MEYILLIILIINLVITIISLTKNINETNITERLGKLENTTVRELYDFRNSITKDLNEDFTKLNDKINDRRNNGQTVWKYQSQ